jgi:hypothetical protein
MVLRHLSVAVHFGAFAIHDFTGKRLIFWRSPGYGQEHNYCGESERKTLHFSILL